jgi:hypothetical protein
MRSWPSLRTFCLQEANCSCMSASAVTQHTPRLRLGDAGKTNLAYPRGSPPTTLQSSTPHLYVSLKGTATVLHHGDGCGQAVSTRLQCSPVIKNTQKATRRQLQHVISANGKQVVTWDPFTRKPREDSFNMCSVQTASRRSHGILLLESHERTASTCDQCKRQTGGHMGSFY